jgi:hypothetical protein
MPLTFLFRTALFACAVLPLRADLYWTDNQRDLILTANDAGTNPRVLVDISSAFGPPTGSGYNPISLTAAAGSLFWTDNHTHKIYRCGLDGSSALTVLNFSSASGLSNGAPAGLGSDGTYLYFVANGGRLWRCRLDGSELSLRFTFLSTVGVDAAGILDGLVWGDSYYFADSGGGNGRIGRAKLDGSGGSILVAMKGLFPADSWGMRGICTDGNFLYWGAFSSGMNGVYRSHLDGSSPVRLVADSSIPLGVTSDGNRLYYSRFASTELKTAAIDGSDVRSLLDVGPPNLGSAPWDILHVPTQEIPNVSITTTTRLEFPSEVGKTYSIRATEDLASPFVEIASLPGTGLPLSYADNRPMPTARFYRVVIFTP